MLKIEKQTETFLIFFGLFIVIATILGNLFKVNLLYVAIFPFVLGILLMAEARFSFSGIGIFTMILGIANILLAITYVPLYFSTFEQAINFIRSTTFWLSIISLIFLIINILFIGGKRK